MLITGKRLSAKMGSRELDLQYDQTSYAKLLRLHKHEELSFNEYAHAICKKLAKRIGTLKRIKGCSPNQRPFYTTIISPLLYDAFECCVDKLSKRLSGCSFN